MSVFINLPSNIIDVDSATSNVSTNPVQNKVIVEAITGLFNATNYNIINGGTMTVAQYETVQLKEPITLNNKIYYCSGDDASYYYYFTHYISGSSIKTSLASIEKSTKLVSFIEATGSEYTEQIVFSTKDDFPETGQENILYVDKQERVSYLWNTTSNTYESIVLESNPEYIIQSVI